MSFSTVADIRAEAVVLADANAYPDLMIQGRIARADAEIIGRLSGKFNSQSILGLSQVPIQISQLSIWLATFKTLSAKHSLNRNEEQSSNINFYKKQIDQMIKELLDGTQQLTAPDGSPAMGPRATFKGTRTNDPASFGMSNVGQVNDVQMGRADV